MSKNGGSEKTTRALVAAYNKSRPSTHASRAEPPRWHCSPLLEDKLSPSSGSFASFRSEIHVGHAGRAAPTGYYKTHAWPWVAPPSSTTCCPNRRSSLRRLSPISCMWTACSCSWRAAPAPSLLLLSCSQSRRQIRHQGVVNVLQ